MTHRHQLAVAGVHQHAREAFYEDAREFTQAAGAAWASMRCSPSPSCPSSIAPRQSCTPHVRLRIACISRGFRRGRLACRARLGVVGAALRSRRLRVLKPSLGVWRGVARVARRASTGLRSARRASDSVLNDKHAQPESTTVEFELSPLPGAPLPRTTRSRPRRSPSRRTGTPKSAPKTQRPSSPTSPSGEERKRSPR